MKRATAVTDTVPAAVGISIHALVKRATLAPNSSALLLDISIHALVKRATTNKAQFLTDKTDFNPRPREEGDMDKVR